MQGTTYVADTKNTHARAHTSSQAPTGSCAHAHTLIHTRSQGVVCSQSPGLGCPSSRPPGPLYPAQCVLHAANPGPTQSKCATQAGQHYSGPGPWRPALPGSVSLWVSGSGREGSSGSAALAQPPGAGWGGKGLTWNLEAWARAPSWVSKDKLEGLCDGGRWLGALRGRQVGGSGLSESWVPSHRCQAPKEGKWTQVELDCLPCTHFSRGRC